MTGLRDIAPLRGTIKLRDVDHVVPGIDIEGIAYLLERFPVLRAVLTDKDLRGTLTSDMLIAMAPEAISAIIAVGLGHINSPEDEAGAANLSFDEKMACVEKIMEVTLPNGIAPFVAMLDRLGSRGAATGWAPGTSSPARSSS